ncbi:MAG: hypothetical protein WCK78_19620 [Paludibacter sp.]
MSISMVAQDVSCDELINYVKKEGHYIESVSALQLLNSEWLREVEAYSIDNTVVVIAKIQQNQYSTKRYIFCGIPRSNWNNFYVGLNDLTKTYGERFHKYIIDYNCNCK